jgi:hypothetical protein
MTKHVLVGRTITHVSVERGKSKDTGRRYAHVHSLTLDNGALVTFSVVEMGSDYAVEARIHHNGASREIMRTVGAPKKRRSPNS